MYIIVQYGYVYIYIYIYIYICVYIYIYIYTEEPAPVSRETADKESPAGRRKRGDGF